MTTYLGKSCSFGLPRVPFVNCRQFMYLVISLLVLRAGYMIWLYQFLIIAYLFTLYTSCHPKHTRNNIPYNLARRLKAIVSDKRTLYKRLEELEEFLIKRKYPLSLIEDAFQNAKSLDRSKLLNTKDSTKGTNIIPYVTTFNPQNPEIYTDIIQHKSILHRNEELHQYFKNKTFLKS